MRDRPGEDKIDASLTEVSIEDICFTMFYYEPTSMSELFKRYPPKTSIVFSCGSEQRRFGVVTVKIYFTI